MSSGNTAERIEHPEGNSEKLSALRILIVDDALVDRTLCRALLVKRCAQEYEVREAADIQAALAICDEWTPDCVLLDYFIRGDVGSEWIQKLKDHAGSQHMPVIMLTGLGDESVAVEAILLGASDYIPKSKLSPEALDRSIGNALHNSRLEASIEHERAQREQIHAQLEEKNDELQSLYHTVSHELKTPLTAAREFVSLLLDGLGGPLTDLQQEYLEITRECCDTLAFLLNNWLDTVRSETGKLQLSCSSCSVARLVEMSVKTYNVLAVKQDLALVSHIAADLPELQLDRPRMEQAIANLLSNAIKFSNPGDKIDVSCGMQDDGVYIEVADHGRGIPADQQARIFNAFAQAEEEDTSEKQGMGLGLHVCKTIVELHGGHISLESEFGRGSRFRIWLPIEPVQQTGDTSE